MFRNTEFDQADYGGVKLSDDDWDKYNRIIYPPQEKGDPVRPAVCKCFLV